MLGGAGRAGGSYAIPNLRIDGFCVYTNQVPCGYMRAPGSPQVLFAVEAHTDLALIDRARNVTLVADSSKIGRVAFARICGISRIDELITDAEADRAALAAIEERGVRVTTVVLRNRRDTAKLAELRAPLVLVDTIAAPLAAPHLARLRARGLSTKRSLALREFALGIEALERFVRKEPLRRVHESVFGVLALESEPVDPRL